MSSATSSASPNDRWSSAITMVICPRFPLRHAARIVGPDLGCFTHLKQVAGGARHDYRARDEPGGRRHPYPDMPFVVTPERVAGFRELFGLAQGVPPTILTAADSRCSPRWCDPRWTSISRAWCTGSQEYDFARAPREGSGSRSRLGWSPIRVRAGTGFVTITIDLVDEAGGHVATCRSSMVERGDA